MNPAYPKIGKRLAMQMRRAVPRQQGFVIIHGGRLRQTFQCVAQPRIRLLAVRFGCFDQAVELRTGRRPLGCVAKQTVLSTDDKRAEGALSGIIVDRQSPL